MATDVVVVEWLYYSKRIIIVRWADLSDFLSLMFVGSNVCFCSTSIENCHFGKNVTRKTGCLLIFLGKETHTET